MTLHEVTDDTKKIILFGSIILIGIFIIMVVFRFGTMLKNTLYPTPAPPPTVDFGKLPPLLFPTTNYKDLKYTLDTLSGIFPNFPDRIKVFPMKEPKPSLLDLARAREKVAVLGFTKSETALNETIYQWSNTQTFSSNIILNTLTYNFNLSSDYKSEPNILFFSQSTQKAEETTQAFFSSLYFPQDIDSQKTKTTPFIINGEKLMLSPNLNNTQVVRVDFYQHDINNFPYFYPYPPYSTMYSHVIQKGNDLVIAEASFFHQEPNISSFGTYPIKTAQEAFSQLQKGKGYIASYSGNDSSIAIKDIILGYYAGEQKQNYLMPVIVFTSDKDFVAYVSAIKEEWINK